MQDTNVLIIGKTGVGKSALINYVYGKEIRKKGAGKPVTEKGLFKQEYEMNNMNVNLYDTWGLEACEAEEWQKIILEEVAKHDNSNSIKDWFHTIFYCFSIQSARIEEFEIKKIINPLIASGNNVVIILTHADVPGAEEKKDGMVKVLLQEVKILKENIISVASEKKQMIGSKPTEPFGRGDVVRKIQENLWANIQVKLPKVYRNVIMEELDDWRAYSRHLVDKKIKFYNRNVVVKKLADEMNDDLRYRFVKIEKLTLEHMKEAYEYYSKLVETLYNQKVTIHFAGEDLFRVKKLNYSRDFEEMMADWLATLVFSLIPIVGLFAQAAGAEVARDNFKNEIDNIYYSIVAEVPHLVSAFNEDIKRNTKKVFALEMPK